MAYETLLYEVDDRVATITLNRPERHNALSQKLCAELVEVVRAADQDPSVRVLVITGAGGKAFSAGYDIKESAEAPKRTLSEWRDRLNRDLRFTYSVWECSKPVIAMIDGFCLAGALEFAQMCDMRIASEPSKFAVIETRFSNGIATYIMPWIIGARCRRLIYTGDMIDAAEALRLGLVDQVFPKATATGNHEARQAHVSRGARRVAVEQARDQQHAGDDGVPRGDAVRRRGLHAPRCDQHAGVCALRRAPTDQRARRSAPLA